MDMGNREVGEKPQLLYFHYFLVAFELQQLQIGLKNQYLDAKVSAK